MAFTNRLALITPSFGSPLQRDSLLLSEGNALDDSTTTTLASLSPTVRAGWVRVRIYAGAGTSPTLTGLRVTFTDATTTEMVFDYQPETAQAYALSSVAIPDFIIPFLLDINASSCSVITTLGGTSPTASMDVEIAPTVGNA